ncbi:hypothetical protein Bca4012_044452 [Brassica carinata]
MCISGGSARQSFRSTVEGSTSGVLLFLLRSRGFSLIWLQAGYSTVYEDCACYVFLFAGVRSLVREVTFVPWDEDLQYCSGVWLSRRVQITGGVTLSSSSVSRCAAQMHLLRE